MPSFTTVASAALAAIAALPAVSAHGYVNYVVVGGQYIFAGDPTWPYKTNPQQPGWFAKNQDNGFIAPDEYGNADIVCHKSATPGSTSVTVAAGSTIGLAWNTWPDSHHGPVINALAPVSGAFSSATAASLKFTVVNEAALLDDSSPPGKWQTDVLIANNFTGTFTIPASIAPGNYVLRHEIIGLHSANNADGAQNYPQCVNLVITGSGTTTLSGASYVGAYGETDPGILIDIYEPIATYTTPGLPLWTGGSGGGSPTSPPKTTLTTSVKSTAPASSTPKTTAPASSTSKASPPPSSTSKPPTSSAPSSSCAAKYAQCGGQGWTGATCCVSGSTCVASGQYYSQCQ